ncbi:KEOPS complex subunit Pcc1 [Halodesulfurarchaeum sp.]|uniref:KEOPS complex subunit Pcc1 n=1 Tax=Halodesulfurarchaeum sp. TaxID=1980530 RepID=UPI002FC332FF
MHETVLSLWYPAAKTAARIEAALQPEAGDIAGDRTTVSITRSERELQVEIQASDPVALRAGQNTWLGFVEVAEAMDSIGDEFAATVDR